MNGISSTGSGTTHAVVDGLENGTSYVFRVAAITQFGIGAYSEPTASVTPTSAAGPSAPRGVRLFVGGDRIKVTWYAPRNTNQNPVQKYQVGVSTNTGPWATLCVTKKKHCLIKGLSPESTYQFRVAATTANGRGEWTSPTKVTRPTNVPKRPIIEEISWRHGKATIDAAPGSLGDVQLQQHAKGGAWTVMNGTKISLARGATQVWVRAVSSGGMSNAVRVQLHKATQRSNGLDVSIDGPRSTITGVKKATLSWRTSSKASWTSVSAKHVNLGNPKPPKAWSLQLRQQVNGKKAGRLTIEIS